MTPTTEAGRALWASLDDYGLISSDAAREAFGEDIATIEQQAAAAERQRLRAAWEQAKLRRRSEMHDIGHMAAAVDGILADPTP